MSEYATPSIQRVTDLYCDGIKDPIPYPGTPAEFEGARDAVRSHASRSIRIDTVLRWALSGGEQVTLDLAHTRVLAMVERRVSP